MSRLFAVIPSLPRAELARLTTRMIDRMDELDGDPDLEGAREDDEPEEDRDPAGDDGCGPFYLNGTLRWGANEDHPGFSIPVYGVDQSAGPVSYQDHEEDDCHA